MIHLHEVVKTFSNAAGEFRVLKGINARFGAGEFVAIIGKSGSGKTTLVNMITGIDRPTSGDVYVDGAALNEMSENRLAVWRGRKLGIVFQFFQLLPMLSLVENVMLPMDFGKMFSARQRKKRALSLLELVDMQDHAYKLPTEISGGQQQRVAIARALANDPPILLADEPTGNLDSKTAESVFQIFERLVQQGKTVVVVTHDSSLAQRASRTVLLADGEIISEYIAQVMPQLNSGQLLEATRSGVPQHYEAGATIVQDGASVDRFFILVKGRAELVLKHPGGADVVVLRPGPGEYFGETELGGDRKNAPAVRAAPETPVELVILDRGAFLQLLSISEETHVVMERLAGSRPAEAVPSQYVQPVENGEHA